VSNGVLEIRILEDWDEVTVSLGGRKQYGTLQMSEGGRLHRRGFKSLVLTDEDCNMPDFSCSPWNEAILITLRHSARTYWNEAALFKHCKAMGNILYQGHSRAS
jgi:hypothetical protein